MSVFLARSESSLQLHPCEVMTHLGNVRANLLIGQILESIQDGARVPGNGRSHTRDGELHYDVITVT